MRAAQELVPEAALFLTKGSLEVKEDLTVLGIKAHNFDNTKLYSEKVTVKKDMETIIDDVPLYFFMKNKYVEIPAVYLPAGTRIEVDLPGNECFISFLVTRKKIESRGKLYIFSRLFDVPTHSVNVPKNFNLRIFDIFGARYDLVHPDSDMATPDKLPYNARFSLHIDGHSVYEVPVHPMCLSDEANEYFQYLVKKQMIMRYSAGTTPLSVQPTLVVCIIGLYEPIKP